MRSHISQFQQREKMAAIMRFSHTNAGSPTSESNKLLFKSLKICSASMLLLASSV
jgi:hypothetical protein